MNTKIPPTHPVFADQRVLGLKLSTRFKAFAMLVVLIAVGFCAYIVLRRAEQNASTKQLACLLVQDTPKGNSLGDQIRKQYGCPAFSNRRLPGVSPSVTVTDTATKTVSPRSHPTQIGIGHEPTPIKPTPIKPTQTPGPAHPPTANQTSTPARPNPRPTTSASRSINPSPRPSTQPVPRETGGAVTGQLCRLTGICLPPL